MSCSEIFKNPDKFCGSFKNALFFIDHSGPSPDVKYSHIHTQMRSFAKKHDSKLFDVGEGISHQLLIEKGYSYPGALLVGASAYTVIAGAVGAAGFSLQDSDAAACLANGKINIKVPGTCKIIITGKIPKNISACDIALYILGTLKGKLLRDMAIEFSGEAVDKLSLSGRMTIVSMAGHLGAVCAFMPIDSKTKAYLKQHGSKVSKVVEPDKGCFYEKVLRFDVSKLKPLAAWPQTIDTVVLVSKLSKVKIQEVFIGSCSQGRLEDLEIAAKILKGKKVNPEVKLYVAAASKEIFRRALDKGLIAILAKAGAIVLPSGCGPCAGVHQGILADKDNAIATCPRNFCGFMGNPAANAYIASASTAAHSAISGKITS
jgi:3-isopropylmalate/(R)-2-methylmalate dehydratase large subunit